jgi:hypothetical protein
MEFMIFGAKLCVFTESKVNAYDICLAKIRFNVSCGNCYQGDCVMSPGTENLINIVIN